MPKKTSASDGATPDVTGESVAITLPQKSRAKRSTPRRNRVEEIDMRDSPAWKAAKVLAGGNEARLTIVDRNTVIIGN